VAAKRPRRVPGQTISCGWCGAPIDVRPTGRLPKWCSTSCRHRAWEQRRASVSGRSPVEVVDRVITVELETPVRVVEQVKVEVTPTGRGWTKQLEELVAQVKAGRVYDRDLSEIAQVLEDVRRAIEGRPGWQRLLRRKAMASQRRSMYSRW